MLARAKNKCEFCGAIQGKPHPITKTKVTLQVMHLDHDPENWKIKLSRLRTACQKCHTSYDKVERQNKQPKLNTESKDYKLRMEHIATKVEREKLVVTRQKVAIAKLNSTVIGFNNIFPKEAVKKVIEDNFPKKKHAGGRPTKYNKTICKKLIVYAFRGMTLSLSYILLGISEGTCRIWKKKYSEFLRTIKLFKIINKQAWIEVGRQNINNKDFNNVLWMMIMSNMHNWMHSNSKIKADIKKIDKKIFEINVYKEDAENERLAKVAAIFEQVGIFTAPASSDGIDSKN